MATWLALAASAGKAAAAAVPVTTAGPARAGSASPAASRPDSNGAESPTAFFIQEYRVEGVHQLSNTEVEEAVYPFLGPGRTPADIEQARAALEKIYHEKGWQTVAVQFPSQQLQDGVVVLQVTEAPVGRLRVTGSRYFSPNAVKADAPSLAEGRVVNFNEVTGDIIALNQNPDRRVTPVLHAGKDPGTVDVDLEVKDALPLHASVELNNRASANTTNLRLNAAVRATNLWQLGHTFGLSFQVAPERTADAKVFSGYYLAPIPGAEGTSLMLQGTKQDSNVSTLGGADVTGRGQTLGLRLLQSLPAEKDFYQSVSLGLDYKHFDQDVVVAGSHLLAPVTYWPLSAGYDATWTGLKTETAFNATVTLHLRGLGSGSAAFNASRFGAEGSFIYLRGDLSQTRELPAGFQLYGKVQGQISQEPLLSAEQFSAGGLGTVRGYLEATTVGDNALFGTVELRSPPLANRVGLKDGDWRVYVFGDAGHQSLNHPLPGQTGQFDLASIGAGSWLKSGGHFNATLDLGLPLIGQAPTRVGDWHLTFRAWADY